VTALSKGIATAAQKAGIFEGDVALTGPQSLLLCADLGDQAARTGPAEREFLAASVAVWREIDWLCARPEGYHGLSSSTDLRKQELVAWERYREQLDLEAAAKGDRQ
jgi:hypothetical protein